MKILFSWAEAKKFYSIGVPIFIAQLSQTGMNFADTAMTGRYNAEDMAAVAIAGSIWAPVAILGIGCLLALPPLSAQMVGSGKRESAAHLLRQGIWITIIISIFLMMFFQIISWHLTVFGLSSEMADLSGSYLRALLWGLPGFMFFVNQRSFFEGFARTRPAMVIGMLGLTLNVPCNYILIYGELGLPAMGATGCGVSSAICYWFMGLAMMWYLRRDKHYQDLRPLFSFFHKRVNPASGKREKIFDIKLILRTLRIGLPAAVALFFEVACFAITSLLLAPLGTVTVAGNQIALNFSALVFMIPLAIGMTVTIRVGYCLGARKILQAKIAGYTGLTISIFFSILIAAGAIYYREGVSNIYNTDPPVVALAMELMFYLGAYQILDAIQQTGLSILRGYNDTRIISLISFVAYWIIGFPIGYILALTHLLGEPMGAEGFWISYLVILATTGIFYWLRVRFLYTLSPSEVFARVGR